MVFGNQHGTLMVMKTKQMKLAFFCLILLIGESVATSGVVFVVHSQTESVPRCPSGSDTLWDGFSLLYTEDGGGVHHQDLGSSGSCLRKFSIAPTFSCHIVNQCNYAYGKVKSFWLSTPGIAPPMSIAGKELRKHISRCSVCTLPSTTIATVHSQTIQIPKCPQDWTSLWIGYSYSGASSGAANSAGQSLSSSGSCLKDFLTNPFIECNAADGNCQYFANAFSFWLATINDDVQFQVPKSKTLMRGNLRTGISRCQVCTK